MITLTKTSLDVIAAPKDSYSRTGRSQIFGYMAGQTAHIAAIILILF
jgi:hypothetical protein